MSRESSSESQEIKQVSKKKSTGQPNSPFDPPIQHHGEENSFVQQLSGKPPSQTKWLNELHPPLKRGHWAEDSFEFLDLSSQGFVAPAPFTLNSKGVPSWHAVMYQLLARMPEYKATSTELFFLATEWIPKLNKDPATLQKALNKTSWAEYSQSCRRGLVNRQFTLHPTESFKHVIKPESSVAVAPAEKLSATKAEPDTDSPTSSTSTSTSIAGSPSPTPAPRPEPTESSSLLYANQEDNDTIQQAVNSRQPQSLPHVYQRLSHLPPYPRPQLRIPSLQHPATTLFDWTATGPRSLPPLPTPPRACQPLTYHEYFHFPEVILR